MHRHDQRPTGPDFLASFAEQNLASGLDFNAHEFRVRADEWRRDQATIASLRDQLQAAEDRLGAAARALAPA